MTGDDGQMTSDGEFEERLKSLLCEAHRQGIEVQGGWDCRNGQEFPDWDVVVTRVEKPD